MVAPPLTAGRLIRRLLWSCALLVVVASCCCLVGSERLSLRSALWGQEQDPANYHYQILFKVRLPRVILAALIGAALACSGAVFQAILQNPLADPYILGVSSGAALGATVATLAGVQWTLWGSSPMALFAFAGAMATVWLVWSVGRAAGGRGSTGLLLAGVVVNAFFSAAIMFLVAVGNSRQVYSTLFWLMGNISQENPTVLWMASGCVIAAVIALFFMGPALNALSFGADEARTMGINASRTTFVSFAIASAVTAVAVSLSGLVGFVGLIIPHAVRLVAGPDHRQLICLSAVFGAAFLVAADTLARTIVAPAQLPVGAITAIIGGPFFLFLLVRNRPAKGRLP